MNDQLTLQESTAEQNQAYVRQLMLDREPELWFALEITIDAISRELWRDRA